MFVIEPESIEIKVGIKYGAMAVTGGRVEDVGSDFNRFSSFDDDTFAGWVWVRRIRVSSEMLWGRAI